MHEPDIKLIQDVKVMQGVVNTALKSNPEASIVLNMVGQIVNQPAPEIDIDAVLANCSGERLLAAILKRTPEPRMRNLELASLRIALKRHPLQKDAAQFLGLSQRAMSYHRHRIDIKEEKNE